MKAERIKDIKDGIRREINGLAKNETATLLRTKFAKYIGKSDDQMPVESAAAILIWADGGFYDDSEEAIKLLQKARRLFRTLAENNRLLRVFERDALIVCGNVHKMTDDTRAAIRCYEEAIAHEQNRRRKAVGLLNMARCYMASNDLYQTMRIVERDWLLGIDDQRLSSYCTLLKARVLGILGFADLCQSTLQTMAAKRHPSAKIEVEWRYLVLYSGWKIDEPQRFLDDGQMFCAGLADIENGRHQGFYEVELGLHRLFCASRSISNRAHFLERAKYLDEDRNFMPTLELADRFIFNIDKTDEVFPALLKSVTALLASGHHELGQSLLVWMAAVLAERKKYYKLCDLLSACRTYRDRLLVGFPKNFLYHFKSEVNRFDQFVQRMKDMIPPGVAGSDEKLGAWLHETAKHG